MAEFESKGLIARVNCKSIKKAVNKNPNFAAYVLSEILFTTHNVSVEKRDLLLEGILIDGVYDKQVDILIDSINDNDSMTNSIASKMFSLIEGIDVLSPELRQKVLNCFLKQKLSDNEKNKLVSALISESLNEKQTSTLLSFILESSLSEKDVSKIIDVLTQNHTLNVEKRNALFNWLLKSPLSSESISRIIEELVQGKGVNKDERDALFSWLLSSPLPSESTSKIIEALIQSKGVNKEERNKLFTWLLNSPLPPESTSKIIEALIQSKGVNKEERKALYGWLLKFPLPSSSVTEIVDALIASKLDKVQCEKLLGYILSGASNKKQVDMCLNRYCFEFAFWENAKDVTKTICEFADLSLKLKQWVDVEQPNWKNNFKQQIRKVLYEGLTAEDALLDLICEGNICHLKDADIEFIDRKQLWLTMQELLFAEEYYNEYDNDKPFILDCGTNIGLAIYYYKHFYPKARIVGFEPWSVAYECAVRNAARNNWENVVIHNVALNDEEGIMEFSTVAENSLAGSLTNRMDRVIEEKNWKKNIDRVTVRKLSDYINEPVDFIKMDIEGVENNVLKEIEGKLSFVKCMFIEYHYAKELKNNSLADILSIIERNNFVYAISKSKAYEKSTFKRPFRSVGNNVSELIWANRF